MSAYAFRSRPNRHLGKGVIGACQWRKIGRCAFANKEFPCAGEMIAERYKITEVDVEIVIEVSLRPHRYILRVVRWLIDRASEVGREP